MRASETDSIDSVSETEVYGEAGNSSDIKPTDRDLAEKNDNDILDSSSEDALDIESPVVSHYMTFETPLPSPTRAASSKDGIPPPPPPDLKAYISPFHWPNSRKNVILYLSCIATMFTAYTAGSYAAADKAMSAEWDVSEVSIAVGVTTFCMGFAIAPMVLAPLSEINGRYPVFVAAGILFEICQICCALTRSFPGMLVARFWTGVGSSVFSTMVGGVVSDLYHTHERNTPMALFSCFVLVGTGLGPLVSGFLAQNLNWRWVFWLQTITCGLTVTAVTIFFRETRGSVLLSRKAHCLNQWYEEREAAGYFGFDMVMGHGDKAKSQRIRWKVKSDEERESISKMIAISVYRPFHLLTTEPVVFFFSLWVAFAWAVLYLTFSSIPLVFSVSHNFNTQQSGAVFAAMSIGSIIATVYSIYQERISHIVFARVIARTRDPERPHAPNPENRLYWACLESALLPIGLFWFGWTQFGSIPWIVPTLSVACATMGIFSVYLATFNYLADTYHRYASSALAAQSFCRNLLGGIFPLVTTQMFNRLTFQGASSLLGGIALILTFVPWILTWYGPAIRARSKFASVSSP